MSNINKETIERVIKDGIKTVQTHTNSDTGKVIGRSCFVGEIIIEAGKDVDGCDEYQFYLETLYENALKNGLYPHNLSNTFIERETSDGVVIQDKCRVSCELCDANLMSRILTGRHYTPLEKEILDILVMEEASASDKANQITDLVFTEVTDEGKAFYKEVFAITDRMFDFMDDYIHELDAMQPIYKMVVAKRASL